MISKKTGIIIVFSILAGLEWKKIYVSDNFEKPTLFKIKRILLNTLTTVAKFTSSLNIGTEYGNLRNYLATVISVANIMKPSINDIEIKNTHISGVSTRVYYPKTLSKERPLLIYYHGGGFVFGRPEDYDDFLVELVRRLNITVVSVDYKMAPENAFPTPTSDCYTVTEYIFNNANEFNADSNRIMLAGDSAGGNAVAVISQKLLAENKKMPKLQILIYPWLQMINSRLPSRIQYHDTGLMRLPLSKFASWYLGIKNVSSELEESINSNSHHALILDDIELRNKIENYLDIEKIPLEYRSKKYYESYSTQKKFYYPSKGLDDQHLFSRDKNLASLVKKLFSSEISPLLADTNKLKGLPSAFFLICEWDTLKDEGLLYAERLRSAGVPIQIGLYEDAFHGIIQLTNEIVGYKVARTMLDNIVSYISENI